VDYILTVVRVQTRSIRIDSSAFDAELYKECHLVYSVLFEFVIIVVIITGIKCVASFEIGRCVLVVTNGVEDERQIGTGGAQLFWLFGEPIVAEFRLA
jgi:hypothetical protein